MVRVRPMAWHASEGVASGDITTQKERMSTLSEEDLKVHLPSAGAFGLDQDEEFFEIEEDESGGASAVTTTARSTPCRGSTSAYLLRC